MKRKVALITFSRAPNFGAFVQAYASNLTMEKHLGVSVVNIDPNGGEFYKNKFYKPQGFVNRVRSANYASDRKRCGLNALFVDNAKELLSVIRGNNVEAVYVGSDQVLNKNCMRDGALDLTTLNGVFGVKKFGLAMSSKEATNIDLLNSEQLKSLSDFNYITVREDDLKGRLRHSYSFDNVEVMFDPSFMLDPSSYYELLKDGQSQNNSSKGVLVTGYNLNYWASEVPEEFGSTVVNLRARDVFRYGLSVCGPIGILGKINKSREVFTNSFHVCAVSIILGKKVSVPFDPEYNGGARMESLIKLFDFQRHGMFYVSNPTESREKILCFVRGESVERFSRLV